jgi:hypothetical protein
MLNTDYVSLVFKTKLKGAFKIGIRPQIGLRLKALAED